MKGPESINSLEELLAHALVLERESVERFEELADNMEVHNNSDLEKLFRKLAHYSQMHADEVAERAQGLELPKLMPWEMKWQKSEAPESVGFEEVHYLMTPHDALLEALRSEEMGRGYYAAIAEGSTSKEVRELAAELAAEEAEHVTLLKDWLARTPDPGSFWDEDLDPPHSPE